jgi:hypothetical protein
VHCCRLKPVSLNDSAGGPDLNSRLKPPSKIVLNVNADVLRRFPSETDILLHR